MATLKYVKEVSISVTAGSWGSTTIVASTGKLLRLACIYSFMNAGVAGSKALVTINDNTLGIIKSVSDSTPTAFVQSEADCTLFADDTSGPKVYGYNAAGTSKYLIYGYEGIEE